MKTPFIIFTKRKSSIIQMSMKDDWIIDVRETYRDKLTHEAQIILKDLNQYIKFYVKIGYSYIRRTR